jgi:hypothetical protein
LGREHKYDRAHLNLQVHGATTILNEAFSAMKAGVARQVLSFN